MNENEIIAERKYPPRVDCWACHSGECMILNDTFCTITEKCAFFKTDVQHKEDVEKAQARLKAIGYKPKITA